ncbi:MAG: hypothetical protein L3K15_08405 [Thermoplasmata archaeon]|nr:hypothetical protein [Thermoplasmata archaeon]
MIDSPTHLRAPYREMPGRVGYVVVKSTPATYLTLQLPSDIAALIGFDGDASRELRAPGRELAFLARGAGICRVISVRRSASLLPDEIHLNRLIASARVSRRRLFFLPVAVARHLGLAIERSSYRGKSSTFDSVAWLVDAPAYYDHRLRSVGAGAERFDAAPLAQVYLTKSIIPTTVDLERPEAPIAAGELAPSRLGALASTAFAWSLRE